MRAECTGYVGLGWAQSLVHVCTSVYTHRYASDDIYTFAGPVLVAINPCKALPLYTPEVANAYKGECCGHIHTHR